MDKQKIRLLRMGRLLTVPVKGEQVGIDIDEDFDLEDSDEKPLKVRCEGPNGLKAGSVIGMLQQLGLSAAEILELAEKGKLQPNDFNNIGAQWEPESDYEDYEPPSKPKITEPCPPPPQVTPEDLANFDQKGPEEVLGMLEQVRRQVQWEVLKEESREQIAWFLENIKKANGAPRCEHIKPDGSPCGSPALKSDNFCHWHSETRAVRRAAKQGDEVEMPVLEDRVGIQLGIMRVCDLLTSKTIDPYTARVLFQGLRLAERTLNKENFLPPSVDFWKRAEIAARKEAREED